MRSFEPRVVLDFAPAYSRAEAHARRIDRDVAELAHLAQIDQQRRRAEAEGERRDEALATGERLRAGVCGQQLHRFGDARRRRIVEGRQLHCSGLRPAVFTTLVQRSISARWNAASSAEVLPIGVVPRPLRRSRKSVCVTALWISLPGLCVTTAGTPAGRKIAYHDVTSNPA